MAPARDIKPSSRADVVVVGGGLAGMSLTALLARHGLSVICIDREGPTQYSLHDYDIRTTAISYGSQRVLAACGAWNEESLKPCAILDIHILNDHSPTLVEFSHDDIAEKKFGWIVENRLLRQTLLDAVGRCESVRYMAPARIDSFHITEDHAEVHLDDGQKLQAALIVGADGRQSFTRQWMKIPVREWSYHQRAIVCPIWHENPHQHIATEHFLAEGPFAVLPMNDDEKGCHRSALVWTEKTRTSHSAMDWNDQTFITALGAHLPDWYGAVQSIGKRCAYPLSFSHAYRYVGPRMALVADAAHVIHPIAGQGLNLGLRDIAALAEILVGAKDKNKDIGSPDGLEEYQRARRFDNTMMAAATDGLDRLFSNNSVLLNSVRMIGLKAMNRLKPAKNFIMRQAMGAPDRHLPKLIRDGKLR